MGRKPGKRSLRFAVALTRRELITIESMLREHAADGNQFFANIAEGFNEATGPLDDIRPIKALSAKEAVALANRLFDVEQPVGSFKPAPGSLS